MMAITKTRRPPRSLIGRKTASIFIQVLIRKDWFSPLDSLASRSRRCRVRSSRMSISSSLRSLGDRPASRPALRPSNWRCLSRFCSSAEAVLAVKVGADIAGADLIMATGRRASPAAV